MNQDQTIALYESVADISGQMLAAARNSDWEALGTLESDCASQVGTLESAEEMGVRAQFSRKWVSDPHFLLRKRTLIEKILADDREIRHLTEAWMAQLSNLLNQAKLERQLTMAYGS